VCVGRAGITCKNLHIMSLERELSPNKVWLHSYPTQAVKQQHTGSEEKKNQRLIFHKEVLNFHATLSRHACSFCSPEVSMEDDLFSNTFALLLSILARG
jgi:hypothetical protein